MKKIWIFMLLLAFVQPAEGQTTVDSVLRRIEENNLSLNVLREQTKARKLSNRIGIAPAGLEIGANYLWGSPHGIGNRTDFSLSQSFDFPTTYGYRRRLADLQDVAAEQIFADGRLRTLLAARLVCIDLAYYDALAIVCNNRLQNANRLADAYKIRLEKGDANQMEYNRAQWNRVAAQTEQKRIEAERNALFLELKQMNGGQPIQFPFGYDDPATRSNDFLSTVFANPLFDFTVEWGSDLPTNFDDWVANIESRNPVLQYANQQIAIGRQEWKLSRARSLPGFSAGYMSEKLVGEHFQGVTFGISLPLWQNANRTKHARAQVRAAEAARDDQRMQTIDRLRGLYTKAVALQKNARALRTAFLETDNWEMLHRSFDQGEISLANYLLEIGFYYDALNQTLDAERNYARARAELLAAE
jgi:outer membrane protein TolC